MPHRYTPADLVDEFSGAIGVEGARNLVQRAAAQADVSLDSALSPQDLKSVCAIVRRTADGPVGIIAEQLEMKASGHVKFDVLFQGLPDPAVVVEFIDEDPIVQAVNREFEDVFGFEEPDLLGRSLNDALIPNEPDVPAADIDQPALDGNRVNKEVRRRTATGEVRSFLFRSRPFESDSENVEAYGVYTDITSRIHRERELERQVELLDRFAETVSHDLKNPLNVARGYLELAQEDHDIAELDTIGRVHGRMEALVDDLLTLARQGRAIGETETVDLEPVVRSVWATVQCEDAELEVPDDLGAIEADPTRLRALLENLLANAVEHGGRDTTVTVRSTPTGFAVCDDGPGIDTNIRGAVFEHGFTTDQAGTGFGLSIVDSVASAHDWDTTVGSSETGGAAFEIHTIRADGDPAD